MARTGRPRKPTHLKLLAGNPGRRPINDKEPQPPKVAPICPKHIQGEERKEWYRVTKELKDMGLLTKADRAALEAYCTSYAEWRKAKDELAKETTRVYKTDKGYPVVSPWLGIMRRMHQDMRTFWSDYGLTPGARTRIRVEKREEEKPQGAKRFLA